MKDRIREPNGIAAAVAKVMGAVAAVGIVTVALKALPELVRYRGLDELGTGLMPVTDRALVVGWGPVPRGFGDLDDAVAPPGDVSPQDVVPDGVQPRFRVALVDAEQDIHPVEGLHGLDGDLVRMPGTHPDDEQFTHPPILPH